MNLIKNPVNITLLFLLISTQLVASDEHKHPQQTVEINQITAQKSGIKTAIASTGIISKQLKIYGKTVNDPSQITHIRARFPGTVLSVNVNIGDQVKAGDTLAYVESNESLKKYPIRALVAGVVVSRHANPGEMALEQVLFTLANFEKIWAELHVFPGQLRRITAGQKVTISGSNEKVNSTIEHIIPSQDEMPYSIARVPINNMSHHWTTGLLVSAEVIINEFEAPLVIEKKSIQTIESNPVVFVKKGNTYESHPIELGDSDNRYAEVLSGLTQGDEYVVENSYLIKADIEKNDASHDH